jgi:hypothetical protein
VGTVGITTARALFVATGDVNGDGLVNLSDHAAFREQQNNTASSFFDVFAEDTITTGP